VLKKILRFITVSSTSLLRRYAQGERRREALLMNKKRFTLFLADLSMQKTDILLKINKKSGFFLNFVATKLLKFLLI
jgi:hypothetical protein